MKRLLILGAGTGGTIMANKMRKKLPTTEWNITVIEREKNHFYQPGFLFMPFGYYQRKDIVRPGQKLLTKGVELIYNETDRIETNIFFTFFGLDAILKNRMDKLHTAVVGNPGLRLPGGLRMPTLLGIIPGMEALTSRMMQSEMSKLDIPPVSEFLDLIVAGGGKIYACKLATDMFKLKKEDFSDHVSDILTVGQFYELAAGEGSHIIFT